MMYLKRAYPAIIVLFIMMALAACGGSTSSGGGGYNSTPATATTSNSSSSSNALQNWPPLLETGSGTSTSATTLPGKLSTQTTTNGNQIEYNGHFLYAFAGDSNPGQTNGNKLFGKWFVATPNLK